MKYQIVTDVQRIGPLVDKADIIRQMAWELFLKWGSWEGLTYEHERKDYYEKCYQTAKEFYFFGGQNEKT